MSTTIRKYSFNDILYNLFYTDKMYLRDYLDTIRNNNLDGNLLTKEETSALNTFENLYRELGTVPTMELFMDSCPNYNFNASVKVNDVLGIIRLFIKQRKNYLVSNLLMDEARKISATGITPEVANNISNLLSSSATEVNYENITNKIIDTYERKIDNSGIKTGIAPVDDLIGGLKEGQVSVVAGFTGHGKSITSVSIMHAAIEQGYNVCYLSLELSSEHLMYNLISRHSFENKFSKKIEHRDLKAKSLSDEDWEYVKSDILPDLKTLPGKFYILDERDIEAYDYFAFDKKFQEIEDLAIEETGKGLDLIIVDHIQMLAFSNQTGTSENTIINRWCNYFRSNCLDFLKTKRQLHVMLVSQINRQGYLKAVRNNGTYNLTAMKEANEIETCASVILSIYSDPVLILSNQVMIGILKNRDGERYSEAMPCPANFAYQLVGGTGPTTASTMSTAELDDLFGIDDFDFGTGIGIGAEFSSWLKNNDSALTIMEVPDE